MAEISQSRVLGLRVFETRSWESEDNLRALLIEAPHALEHGLRVIDAVLDPADSCRFDLLALDKSGLLVLVETAVQNADALFLRALDHYRWTIEHLDLLVRLHRQHSLDAGRPPRLLLAMPEIPLELKARSAQLTGINITLVEVRYLEAKGVRGLWARRLALAPPPVVADTTDEAPRATALTDEELRTLMNPLTTSSVPSRPLGAAGAG
jgi:hypothetical protein